MAAAEQDDDLLDNWEDIDENPSLLEKQLEKLSMKNAQSQPEATMTPSQVVTCEENTRTPFTPGEPKIMILKRPQEKVDSASNGMINKLKQPVKSLEQRQQEYAEARLRILGDAGSNEENKPKPIQQKSLEQREADYAAARLRIMGSASKSVEEPMLSGSDGGVLAGTALVVVVGVWSPWGGTWGPV
ncbi:hypothetical protein Pmani_023097 [Petrolisthes manimaculis]|uniref:SUZ domain-containing protein n=1 Tax=Petrolisthes manimaculis TaxID=1843537 RepID=A0AAE1U3M6_9EUCA|nr:hypothetical protein Pmani_023097 [Petrolisthes manimaculis]